MLKLIANIFNLLPLTSNKKKSVNMLKQKNKKKEIKYPHVCFLPYLPYPTHIPSHLPTGNADLKLVHISELNPASSHLER